jgi:voltage-gated potassium channel
MGGDFMSDYQIQSGYKTWQTRLFTILFESDTYGGKIFDVILLILILSSTAGVMLESVETVGSVYRRSFLIFEWVVTIVFAVEYVLRILSLRKPQPYAFSFFGIIDLLAFLPTFTTAFFAGRAYFVVIRAVRLLRVFRIFKLGRYVSEGNIILKALIAGRQKILVFLFGVGTMVMIIGTLMYIIEGAESGYSSIPRSIYWAIVTLTTVGYGDIAPQTVVGQMLASIVMILGYSIIAVPTGIVTVEMGRAGLRSEAVRQCSGCGCSGHDSDAVFCKQCGNKLNSD